MPWSECPPSLVQILSLSNSRYRKIPGDQCTGGFKPKADSLMNLYKNCSEGEKFINTAATGKAGVRYDSFNPLEKEGILRTFQKVI
jgi:hypothetical protein